MKLKNIRRAGISILLITVCFKPPQYPDIDRHRKIPPDIYKRTPEHDLYPPILHSDEYEYPVPLGAAVNTAGGEDSPFILPDGKTLYFCFISDVRLPAEAQLFDSVTGVWVSYDSNGNWTEAQRVWLQDPGKLAIDGAVCVQGDEMWFASAREGYTGVNMFTARFINGRWQDWRYVGDRLMKEIQIGEAHIHNNDLYFHSARTGGKGARDIWVTTRTGNNWSDPINIAAVNTADDEYLPFVSTDGKELWFSRTYRGAPAIFRSKKSGDTWTTPELIISQFAAEPTLDDAGNLYFAHHFIENTKIVDADIYLARRKAQK